MFGSLNVARICSRNDVFVSIRKQRLPLIYLNIYNKIQVSHRTASWLILSHQKMYAPFVSITMLIWLLSQVCHHNATIPTMEKNKIVALQNSYRRKEKASNMNKLIWSVELAKMAEKWVQECIYGHGGLDDPDFVDVGQNLYITSANRIDYRLAIGSWYAEKNNYDFDTQTCRSVCGHYTQLVWADTILVGCAWKNCSSLKGSSFGRGFLMVCNYAAAGNYPDQDPYVKGEPCSGCPGSCEGELCIAEY